MRCGHVAVGGRPNVGKSTLFNNMMGRRLSIVTRKRNTTRFCIRGVITDDESQVILVDTPGWQVRGRTPMGKALSKAAATTLPHCDAGLLVVDANRLCDDDRQAADLFTDEVPVVCALNKTDRVRGGSRALLPLAKELSTWRDFHAIVPVSALTGDGLSELKKVVVGMLPERERIYPAEMVSDKQEEFFVAELVREQVYRNLGAELPYSAAVEVKSIMRDGDNLVRVAADILVDTRSRQSMFVGARGAKIKAIGSAARSAMETMMGSRVFLDLQVRVRKDWSRNPSTLARLALRANA